MKIFPLDIYEQERNNQTSTNMETILVTSTQITQIGYNPEKQTLRIWFNSGHTYDYQQIPQHIYTSFKQSPSKGQFFSTNIKKIFPYTKI